MLYSSHDELVADAYFSFVNDLVGILAISLAATALQFEHPQPFACFFLIITVLWAFSKISEYNRVKKSYAARFKGVSGYIQLFWRLKFFFVGLLCLTYVAVGLLTKDLIYKTWGY